MPYCTICKHYPDVQSGKYDNVQWSKVPCSKCRYTGDQPNKKGQICYSVDALEGGNGAETFEPAVALMDDTDWRFEAFRCLIRDIMSLSLTAREVVCRRLIKPDESLTDIAADLGVTVQACQQGFRTACRKHKSINTAFRYAEQLNRKGGTA